ncbi:MAG: hypothetical protein ACI82Z_001784, partial [Cellvibrionaceae bacterium]
TLASGGYCFEACSKWSVKCVQLSTLIDQLKPHAVIVA